MGNYGGRETYAEWRAQLDDCMMALYADPDPRGRVDWLSPIHVGAAGWPQVSSVPRNFSAEPATWYDFTSAYNSIGTDSFSLEIEFFLDVCTQKIIFYQGNSYNGIGVFRGGTAVNYNLYVLATNIIISSTTGNPASVAFAYGSGAASDTYTGSFTVKIERIGTTVSLYVNGVLGATATGSAAIATNLLANLQSAHNGTLSKVDLKNLTTGKTLWSYPSFAERTRLVRTMDNVLTRNAVLEGAVSGVNRRVKTPLDFRGNDTSKTFFCRVYVPSHVPDGKLYLSGLITQGAYNGNYTAYVFGISVWEDYRTTSYGKRLYITYAGASTNRTLSVDVSELNIFDRWVTIVGVFDYVSGRIIAYLDGIKIGEAAVTMEPFGLGAVSPFSDAVSILHDSSDATRISGHRVEWAHIYNGVLPDWEIALMSAA